MIRIIDIHGNTLENGQSIHLNDVSIRLQSVYSLYVVSSTSCSVSVSIRENYIVTGYDAQSNITKAKTHVPAAYTSNGLSVHPIHILTSHDVAETRQDFVTVTINGVEYVYMLEQTYIDVDDRLLVLTNNYKWVITDDWYTALRHTDIHEAERDQKYMNEKRREFLLEFFNLTGLIGSYRGLSNALDFFEYSDFAYIKEYWKSFTENKWRQTDITTQVADVDIFNDGYQKTNWLGLFYRINVQDMVDPWDDDGIPQMVLVDVNFDDLYVKLIALRQILQDNFLPDNVKIVDIVGEHTSYAGIDVILWLHSHELWDLDPHEKFDFLEVGLENVGEDGIVYLEEHKLIIDSDVYRIDGTDIEVPPGNTSHYTSSFMRIIRTDDELEDPPLEEFDILTKFYRGDVAVINIQIKFTKPIPSSINRFKVALLKQVEEGEPGYDEDEPSFKEVYVSSMQTAAQLQAVNKYGLKETGTYKVCVYIFDGYGNFDVKTTDFFIRVEDINIEYKLLRPKYADLPDNFFRRYYTPNVPTHKRDIIFDSTHEIHSYIGTDVELFVPDANDPTFDIHDRSTAQRGYRSYRNDMDTFTLSASVLGIGHVPVGKMNRVPLSEYATYYWFAALDIFDGGTCELKLKDFRTHDWISVECVDTNDPREFLVRLHEASEKEVSAFSRFTFRLINVSLSNSLTDYKTMLLMYSKSPSFTINNVIYEMTLDGQIVSNMDDTTPRVEDFDKTHYIQNKIYPFYEIPATIRIDSTKSDDGDLAVEVCGDEVLFVPNVSIPNSLVLYNYLKQLENSGVHIFVMRENDQIIVFCRDGDITISHPSIGYVHEIVRKGYIENLYEIAAGDDFQIASVVMAYPDEEHKFENADFRWTVYDSYTNRMIHTTNNKMFKYLALQYGTYSLELSVTDLLSKTTKTCMKRGAFTIQ